MYKYFLSLIFLLVVGSLHAQESFNTTFFNNDGPNARTVFALEDTAFATVGGAHLNGDLRISINITDVNGDLINSKNWGQVGWNFYYGSENACIRNHNNEYVLPGTAAIINPLGIDSAYIYLTFFNESLDSIFTKSYMNDTVPIETFGVCQTKDNGYLLVGKTYRKANGALTYPNSYDAFMLKVDSSGTQEWYRTFGRNLSGNDEEYFYKVLQTPDDGYLCLGYTQSWQTAETVWDRGDWWLVKTDSLGQEEWRRQYGHPDYDDGRPYGLMMASDTSYYLIGTNTLYQIGSNDVMKAHIIKLDKNFNEVFEKDYGGISRKNCFFSIIENTENDLVLTGYFHDPYELYSERGVMYKLNSDGDSIWRRQYTCHDTLNSKNRPYSIKQTPDGGYVFTGIAYDNELEPAQQIWLVKTDEYGCDGTDWWACATDVMIQEYANSASFKLYPNPTKNEFFVKFKSRKLKVESVCIYDITGKIVKNVAVNEVLGSLKLDVSDLESGVYMVKVGEQMQKLVVE